MNCKLIKEKIDHLVFEKNELSVEEISNHIAICDSCQSYFNESKETNRLVGLMKEEPTFENTKELTNSILSSIEDVDQLEKTTEFNSRTKIFHLVRRSLAVASVSLMLIFGIEQYIVFDKILILEEDASNLSAENIKLSFKNLVSFNTDIKIEDYNQILDKGYSDSDQKNIRTRIMIARLSSISSNKLNDQQLNQFRVTVAVTNNNYLP